MKRAPKCWSCHLAALPPKKPRSDKVKPRDLVGTTYGSWTVVGYNSARASRGVPLICRCACGAEGYRSVTRMKKHPHCQKCRRYVQEDLLGFKVGTVTVIGRHAMTKSGAVWRCRCDCGNDVFRTTSSLKRGAHTGCKACEPMRRAQVHLVHGGALGGKSRLYNIWLGMLKRCRDLEDPNYGGKGIAVCEEWLRFPAFRHWAFEHGYANTLSIDRMNPNKGYNPSNCEWVTRSENSRRVRDPKIKEAA